MQGQFFLALPVVLPVILGILQYAIHMDERRREITVAVSLFATAALGAAAAFLRNSELMLWRLTDNIAIELFVDGISQVYLLLIALVWPFVGLYSTEYLEFESRRKHFFLFYMITYGVLNALAMSRNVITMYMFYECMTLCTVPLVLFNGSRESVAAATKYLVYSVFGASAALLGIFFVGVYGSGFRFQAGGILDAAAISQHEPLALAIVFVMLVGFGVKAGLFPMHSWLPTAHPVAPAPASAVLSGVITKMGVLGVIRVIYDVAGVEFLRGTWVQYAFMALTLITVILGSAMALQEKQLKKRLAYSTVSQVSYVLFGLSTMTTLGFVGAMLHIVFHSLIKNTLFMSAGSIIHKTGLTRAGELRGIGKRMPATMWCFTLVSLGLIGIPPTGGFISKWQIAEGALCLDSAANWIGPAVLLVSAVLTAAYLLPVALRGFFPGEDIDGASLTKCEVSWRMLVPMVLFSALVFLAGMFPNGLIHAFSEIARAIM